MNYKFSPHASDTKAEVEQLTVKLNEKLDELRTSDGYRNYLCMQSRFPHYSLNNCLLIMAQKPDAQHVAGYTVWASLGRHVNTGEHGIRIMAPRTYKRMPPQEIANQTDSNEVQLSAHVPRDPNADSSTDKSDQDQQKVYLSFRPISVFDVSQTSGKPLPTLTANDLQGRVDGYVILRDSLIEASPVPVRFDTITDGVKGYYSPVTNEIVIKAGMSEQQTLKTLAHEIGHAVAHSPDNLAVNEKSRAAKETEAESIAYIVCSHYGIETDDYTFPYIGSWSSEMDDRQLSAKITGIKGTAVSIIDQTDICIYRRLSEQRSAISYQIPEGYLAIKKDSTDGFIQYHLYDSSYHETKSGSLQLPPQISIQNAAEQVLLNHGIDPQNKYEIPAAQLQEHLAHSRQNVVRHMH